MHAPTQVDHGDAPHPSSPHDDLFFFSLGCVEETSAGLHRLDPDLEMGFLAAPANSGVCFTYSHWLGRYRKSGAPHLPDHQMLEHERTPFTAESSWVTASIRLPMLMLMPMGPHTMMPSG